MTDEEYRKGLVRELINIIVFYENRYGVKYEDVVKIKGNPSLSNEWRWCREGKEWREALKRLDML